MRRVILILFVILSICSYGKEKLIIATSILAKDTEISERGMLIIREAFKKIGYQIEIVYLPSERSIRSVESGEYDGELSRAKDAVKTFKNIIIVNEPIKKSRIYAYTTDQDLYNMSWEKLKNYRVGALLGFKKEESALKDKMIRGEFIQVKDPSSLIKMVVSGRADYIVMQEMGGKMYIKDNNKIKRCEPYLEEVNYYFVLNKKHSDIAEKLAKAIREVKKEMGLY